MHTRAIRRRHGFPSLRGTAVGLILSTALVACGSDDDGAASSSGPTTTAARSAVPTTGPVDDVEVGATAVDDFTSDDTLPPATGSVDVAPASSGPAYPLEFDGVTVTAPQQAFGQVVGVRDGFVRVATTPDRQTIVTASESGDEFVPIESDLSIGYVAAIAASEDRVVAVGTDERAANLTVWQTDDGGFHWSQLPPPPSAAAGSELITIMSYVQGVAVAGDQVVVTAVENETIDWEAYAVDVLGESHGPMSGMSSSGGAIGNSVVTVTYADGTEMTVDLAELGVTDPTTFMPGTVVVQTFDGASWTRTPQPGWTSGDGTFEVVAGPAGFAVLTQRELTSGGPVGQALRLSADGIVWTTHPVDGLTGFMGGTLGAGTHGYIAATDAAIWHSPDGVEWRETYEVPDLSPSSTSMPSSRAVAGGTAGFVAVVSESAGRGSSVSGTVFWSPDGRSWQTEDISDPAVMVWASAVDSDGALVVPDAPPGPASMPPLPADDDELIAAMADGLDPATRYGPDGPGERDLPPLSEAEALCVATTFVDGVGAERIREQRPWAREEAEVIVDAYRKCTPNWKWLLAFDITEGADWLSADTMTCVQATLDDGDARALFIEERTYESDRSSEEHQAFHDPLLGALEECATPQELNALDWN